jgi:hypothetical protein
MIAVMTHDRPLSTWTMAMELLLLRSKKASEHTLCIDRAKIRRERVVGDQSNLLKSPFAVIKCLYLLVEARRDRHITTSTQHTTDNFNIPVLPLASFSTTEAVSLLLDGSVHRYPQTS